MQFDSERHPDYIEYIVDWQLMRDAARGASRIEAGGTLYLPMPSGFRLQEDGGLAMYRSYATRAQFPDILAPTLRGMVGLLHEREADIKLPKDLERIWEQATPDGLPLEAFHRRITREILLMGRFGVLVDAPSGGSELPYLAGYTAESIVNWSADRSWFVLDETRMERFDTAWRKVKSYRELLITDDGFYAAVVHDEGDVNTVFVPSARAGRRLGEIPMVIIGGQDLSIAPEEPPLMGVARSAVAIYRLDADYRHQLFNTGQETLVVIGGQGDNRPAGVGAAVAISLPAGSDAKYVGPAGTGIAAHRTAILDERAAAVSAGARLFDSEKRAAESGEALRIRQGAQTATLKSVALASAQGLEKALRYAAVFVGANPDEVVVRPNLDFLNTPMTPQQAAELLKVWQGGGISRRTLYEGLQRGGIASPERSFEDEADEIAEEGPALGELTSDHQH